jgi:hypothetical protein
MGDRLSKVQETQKQAIANATTKKKTSLYAIRLNLNHFREGKETMFKMWDKTGETKFEESKGIESFPDSSLTNYSIFVIAVEVLL